MTMIQVARRLVELSIEVSGASALSEREKELFLELACQNYEKVYIASDTMKRLRDKKH